MNLNICQLTLKHMLSLPTKRAIFLALFLSAIFTNNALAQNFQTRAKQALLIDADTGTVLYAKNQHEKFPPASLAKIMTMEVVFSRLKDGNLSLSDKFFISEDAWRRGGAKSGGSTMFAKLKSEIALEDLIKGVIIQSANDGAIAIAEGLAGSESAFSNLMNERARKIGMKDSTFRNATGLPDENQFVTVDDLAKLAQHVINEYPQYYSYYSELAFTWNKIEQRNRNPLLAMNIGADGFKTGFTEASGYAIIGSAVKDGQRLITVLSGMESKKQRAEEARKILDWGFRAFEKLSIFGGEEELAQVGVYGGDKASVGVTSGNELEIFLPVGNRDRLKARVAYQYPLLPPIEKGDQVATLKIWLGDVLTQESPLYASEDVNKGGLKRRATDAIQELLTSWIPN